MQSLCAFDVEEDKYMALTVNYRGDVDEKGANETMEYMKKNKKFTMVEWCPNDIHIGINEADITLKERDELHRFPRSVVMMGNNTAFGGVIYSEVSQKHDLMYSQRAYVHWYVAEGMEEGEFEEAREDLGFLEKDYFDVLSEQVTEEVI